MRLEGLCFCISYVNALFLPICHYKYATNVFTLCSRDMFCVFQFHCVNFKFSCRFDSILFLVMLEMFKFLSCEALWPAIISDRGNLSHPRASEVCAFFFRKLLSLGQDFRSEAKDMVLYLCAIYKG